ncbi:MAG: ABC transporter ATP-binding protein/permease [Treponema sp.]|nr:ABC transporter ATP-binding protein/permease [Treponema sp.]
MSTMHMGGGRGHGAGPRGHRNDPLGLRGADGKAPKVSVLKTVIRLWHYLARYRGMIILLVFLTFLSNSLALLGPFLSGRAIDAIEPGIRAVDFSRVFYYAGLMAIFYVVSACLNYLLAFNMISLSQRCARQMRKEVFEKLMVLPVSYFDNNQTGDILSRISYDIDTVNTSLANDLIQVCTTVVTVTGSLIMMLAISPLMSLIFFVTVPLATMFIKYHSTRIHGFFRNRSAKLGILNGFVEEIVSGMKTIKAYNREKTTISRFDIRNNEAVSAYFEADYHASSLGPAVNFINNISLSLISVFGAILYLLGRLSLGSISAFILYSRRFSGPINEAANILAEIQSAAAAADRIFQLLDEEPEKADVPDANELIHVKGKVELKDIHFGYVEDKPVLKNVSLLAPPGGLIAIVGQTGAGKTTIINLLMRFYDPETGTINIDGHVITGVTRKSLRLAFAMVLQESWLFHGTVYENIAYGSEGATREKVETAAKAAQAHNFIMQLSDGYDTVLSENGVNISQGQKQLLTIARAMLLDVRMLILDEATSNVDTRTEIRIQEAMRTLMKDKTCFIIAHRLSTIQNADLILVMDKGSFAEQGTHEELLQKNGVYANLYQSQFG